MSLAQVHANNTQTNAQPASTFTLNDKFKCKSSVGSKSVNFDKSNLSSIVELFVAISLTVVTDSPGCGSSVKKRRKIKCANGSPIYIIPATETQASVGLVLPRRITVNKKIAIMLSVKTAKSSSAFPSHAQHKIKTRANAPKM